MRKRYRKRFILGIIISIFFSITCMSIPVFAKDAPNGIWTDYAATDFAGGSGTADRPGEGAGTKSPNHRGLHRPHHRLPFRAGDHGDFLSSQGALNRWAASRLADETSKPGENPSPGFCYPEPRVERNAGKSKGYSIPSFPGPVPGIYSSI